MKICVDYVFEYFNNYLNITEAEEKTILHNEKLDKYRKQLKDYELEVREWVVSIYNDYGKQVNRYVGNILKEDEFFFLYDSDSEFRNTSYNCYSQLIKRFSFLKDQTEMLFLFIKDYQRVQSQQRFSFGIPTISDELNDWIVKTWAKHQVNLLAFAFDWIDYFLIMKIYGLHLIEKKARIAGESMITIINKRVIFSILTLFTEKCPKNHS